MFYITLHFHVVQDELNDFITCQLNQEEESITTHLTCRKAAGICSCVAHASFVGHLIKSPPAATGNSVP